MEETLKRISYLIPFESSALFLLDEESSDFILSECNPTKYKNEIKATSGTYYFQINQGKNNFLRKMIFEVGN